MAFIDVHHQHPWPTIDTLLAAKQIRERVVIIHHELNLFMTHDSPIGVGPKYLYNQFPDVLRTCSSTLPSNIFSWQLQMPHEELVERAKASFALPWTLQTPLSDIFISRIEAFLSERYSHDLATRFLKCAAKFGALLSENMDSRACLVSRID
jgi:hypothetical protein